MNINYIEGDLFAAIKNRTKPVCIPHICNNQGAWGAGFVVPLGRNYPKARERYLAGQMKLGRTGFLTIEEPPLPRILICNMIAQELGGMRPLFYNALAKCLDRVARRIDGWGFEIHAPAFGSGLAGGDWKVIEPLIQDCWIRSGVAEAVNIYFLPGTFLPPELPTEGPVDRPYTKKSHTGNDFPG